MPTSQNGYSANDRSVIASYTVPGTSLKVALRRGDVSVVLLEYLRRYNVEVEPLTHNPQDLWGYAERTIRGSSTTLSNHASGTAVDGRATRHPLGVRGTFTAQQLAALDRLLFWFEGVIRHGKDYTGRVDEMHAEVDRGAAEVKRIADKIRSGGDDMAQVPQPEWNQMRDTVARLDATVAALAQAMLGKIKPWGGGISDRAATTVAEQDAAEPYNMPMFILRNNVTAYQTVVAQAQMRDSITALDKRVSVLIGLLEEDEDQEPVKSGK